MFYYGRNPFSRKRYGWESWRVNDFSLRKANKKEAVLNVKEGKRDSKIYLKRKLADTREIAMSLKILAPDATPNYYLPPLYNILLEAFVPINSKYNSIKVYTFLLYKNIRDWTPWVESVIVSLQNWNRWDMTLASSETKHEVRYGILT